MMQQGGQGSEGRHPSSPGGSSNNMSKFCLLGQQLTTYGSSSQQHHQNSSNHANMSFSLGGHSQQPPSLTRSFSQGQSNGPGVGCSDDGGGYSNMQNVNSLVNVGAAQLFNQNQQQFMNQQVIQGNGSSDFLKASQQQVGVQSLGMSPGGATPEALVNVLQVFQQSLGQLQAMVPLLAQNQQLTNPIGQQQAAAAAGAVRMIAQIAQAAANFLPNTQQPSSIPDSHQLSQLFGASVTPGFNFFQQGGSVPLNDSAGNGVANSFPRLQGASGVSVGIGAASGSLANQVGGAPGGNLQNSGLGLGGAKGGSPQGGPGFGGQGAGGNNGSGSASNSAMAMRNTKHGSPRNNQMGNGSSRVGAVPSSLSVDVSQMILNNPGLSNSQLEDHDMGGVAPRDEDDDGDTENLPPGSYELVEMEAIEILAEHTHFCEICGKGFKRDANLRMHMRGHGDEYKTPAALARPDRASHESSVIRPRRFSCPFLGCKRNKKHRKFQPLKTMLCVKNHYRRSHCPKILTCQKCKTKKFSVVADLKTHEKHCGCDKWQCSCGTTFSRKDKLFGHIGLFAGHTPALPFNDVDTAGTLEETGSGTPQTMHVSGSNSSGGFGGGNMKSGNTAASSMGLGGGSGMGLSSSGLQGLATRGANNMSKDVVSVGQENSGSSDSFPQSGNLLPVSSMLQGYFTANFLQSPSGGNSSTDALQ